jgi:hypothetical protein
LLIFF